MGVAMEGLLEIVALGRLSIQYGDQVLTTAIPRKGQALLVYLACTGRAHSREALAEFLWPERAQERAMSNLRTLASRLREHLTPYLLIERQSVAFNRDSLHRIDTLELEAAIDAAQQQWLRHGFLETSDTAQLAQALALYQGEFLAEFYVPESPAFEAWAASERGPN